MFIKIDEVALILGISRATIYRRLSTPGFPQKVSVGGRTARWCKDEVLAYFENCKKASRK